MYETLITKITAILESVDSVKDVFSVPKTKLTKFPSVFFKPAGLINSFETQNENMKTYRFLCLVMVGTSGTTIEKAFGTVLPGVVDDIIAQFDEDWNVGTINGHRGTVKIDTAEEWELSEEQDGLVAFAPLSIEVRLLTSN